MSRHYIMRTLLCEKLTEDTRNLIWTYSRGRDTGTILAIPAQRPGLTCSGKRTLFASPVFTAVITVIAKIFKLCRDRVYHDEQGRPARP